MSMDVKSYIRIAPGFQKSVNLAYDLNNMGKIEDFIPSTSALEIIEPIILSTHPSSTDRAHILIGPYGNCKCGRRISRKHMHVLLRLLRPSGFNEIEVVCYIPYEEQATKWTPELRNRYFDALTSCTEVVDVSYEKTVGCEFKSHFEAMKNADTLIIVYDPTDPICERETAIVAVVKEWNKQVIAIDPKAIRLF